MGRGRRLSFTAFSVLYAMANEHRYGFDIMEATGLASGTVYPILSRLERDGLVVAAWEDEESAAREGRPARKYYTPTEEGWDALRNAVSMIRQIGGGELTVPGWSGGTS